ncbi:terpenoid synthase [Xylaria sp. FL0043]|nr:terpenoid synthase [Xylaria sp. FL0043]
MAAVLAPRAVDDPRPHDDPRIGLSAKLLEKAYYLPNLKAPYKDWPHKVNVNYPQLREALNARITELYPPARAKALIKGDYSLLSSMWWPRASYERLETCTFWFLWLFTWDDEIDQSTSELFINLPNANQFRDESYHFVRWALGVPTEETAKYDFENKKPDRPLIRSLDVIGANLQKVYNKEQIMVFVDEIYYYMDCQQREQGRKLTGVIPTPEQYWETRLGTSAVTSMLALNEYADDQNLPRWIMTHEKMTDIWREVNLNMSLSNDMMSLKKEIIHGDIDSIVPVLVYNRGFSVQEAIADTCKELEKNINRFDETADDLVAIVQEKQPEVVEDLKYYIVGCRHNQMANLLWSLVTTRYGLGDIPRDADGGMTINVL